MDVVKEVYAAFAKSWGKVQKENMRFTFFLSTTP